MLAGEKVSDEGQQAGVWERKTHQQAAIFPLKATQAPDGVFGGFSSRGLGQGRVCNQSRPLRRQETGRSAKETSVVAWLGESATHEIHGVCRGMSIVR